MKTRRSRDGHVMGNPPAWVADKLVQSLRRLTGPFHRHNAREMLMEEGVSKEHADAMVHALCRVPGVTHDGDPIMRTYRRPSHFRRNTRHRTWRITPRRLNVHDAEVLAGLLRKARNLTPNLDALLEQLTNATGGLE